MQCRALSLTVALVLTQCQRRHDAVAVERRPVAVGRVVARVGGEVITTEEVATLARARHLSPQEALQEAIRDELLAQDFLRTTPAAGANAAVRDARWRAAIQGFLARRIEGRTEAQMPTIFPEALAARRFELSPGATRATTHVVFTANANDAAGRTQAMAQAVAFHTALVAGGPRPEVEAFRARARATSGRLEDLPPSDAEGRFPGGTFDPAFVRALWAVTDEAPVSPPFFSSFGAHVLLLTGTFPASTRIAEETEAIVRQQLPAVLSSRALREVLEQARVHRRVEIDPSALLHHEGGP